MRISWIFPWSTLLQGHSMPFLTFLRESWSGLREASWHPSRIMKKCLRIEDDLHSPRNDELLSRIDLFSPVHTIQFHELGNGDIISAGNLGKIFAFFDYVDCSG